MKSMALGYSRGLTLVELLVVLAVLAVVAAVTALNVGGMFAGQAQISERASYTIYVVEEGVQKNLGITVFGDVLIRYPRRINIGDSKEISLTVIPPGNVTSESNVTGESTDGGIYYIVSDEVELYSVMSAELNGVNFGISDISTQYKEVSTTSRTDWVWIITPNTVGEQLLRVELSTPVLVQGYEELVSRAVYSQQMQILVRKPFSWRSLLDYWHIIVITLAGTVGAVFGLRKLWRMRKRKKRKMPNSDVNM